jgi:hypothetical protein
MKTGVSIIRKLTIKGKIIIQNNHRRIQAMYVVLHFAFRSVNIYELVFVCDLFSSFLLFSLPPLLSLSFFLWHSDDHLFEHYLLKRFLCSSMLLCCFLLEQWLIHVSLFLSHWSVCSSQTTPSWLLQLYMWFLLDCVSPPALSLSFNMELVILGLLCLSI